MRISTATLVAGIIALTLAGCGDDSKLPEQASTGPNPQIPAQNRSLIPTVNIATAIGWPSGAKPVRGEGPGGE